MLRERSSRVMKAFAPTTLMIAAFALLLSAVLALVDAELPPDTPLWQALPIWLAIVGTAVTLMVMIDAALGGLADGMTLPPVARTASIGMVTVLVTALPVALMCLPLENLVPDGDALVAADASSPPVARLLWAWADQYLNLLPATAGVWLLIAAIRRLMPEKSVGEIGDERPAERRDEGDADDDLSPQPSSELARRHPDIACEGLLAIEADEHYVRFHTPVASRHVLYRFRDALKDVEGLPGLQVHRSWWVAADAIEDTERAGSTLGLKLANGLTVPVSQTYRRDVEKLMDERERLAS